MLSLITSATLLFNSALNQVNEQYKQEERIYHIELAQNEVDPKEPIFLKVVYPDGHETSIGAVHAIKIEGSDFDERLASPDFYPAEWEKIALTVDQLRDDIFARVNLFFDSTSQEGIFSHPKSGQLFNFGLCNVVVNENDTFSINGKEVTYEGEPLELRRIVSTGIIEFCILGTRTFIS